MNNKLIAISIGDIEGIGIELLIKLWKMKLIKDFILVTNLKIFRKYLKKNSVKIPIKIINNNKKIQSFNQNYFNIFDFKANDLIENTYKSLKISYKLCKKGFCKGLITLPLNKNKIIKNIDKKFIGQTEFFEKIDNKKKSNMIFYSQKIIVTSLTTHIPFKKIINTLKKKNFIYEKIKLLQTSLKNDFNIKKPKMAICGLNPHAGEGSTFGNEEEILIKPIIKKLNKENIYVKGPFPPDSIFAKKNITYYDCIICNYHDQALIPFKLISNNNGVNYTTSLSIIRLSPDHGTAYDLVGTNKANHKSLLLCFNLINKINKNRF